MAIINLENVTVKIGNTLVFDQINLNLKNHRVIGIIGENGSGKSVLFKTIAGFVLPKKGIVEVQGDVLNKNRSFPKDIGLLIEEPSFIQNITGFENLKLLASIKDKIADDEILKTLRTLGLERFKDKKVGEYSLGMKKKLAICQAIMENQSLLILDEPMNALDDASVQVVRTLIKNYSETGHTVLLASHNKEDIEHLCDEVYEIKNYQLNKIR